MLAPATRSPLAHPPDAQADDDHHLLALWLHERPASTQRAFLAPFGLRSATLGALQAFADAPHRHAHQRGALAALIRDTLGHASIATTDRYLQSSPDDGSALWLD